MQGFAEGFFRQQVLELGVPGCCLQPVDSVGPEVTPSEIVMTPQGRQVYNIEQSRVLWHSNKYEEEVCPCFVILVC